MGVKSMSTSTPRVLGANDRGAEFLGSIGVRFMIDGAESGGGFALVEHPMSARALGAPIHRHTREDEYSYVLEGRIGALLGDQVVEAGPGSLIFKPPLGYRTYPVTIEGKRFVKSAIVPEEAEVVTEFYQTFINTKSGELN